MTKIEIDNKKMWESLRKAMWYFPEAEWLTRSIDTALSEQGLTVNDKGEITTIESEVKWYVALNDYGHYINTIGAVPLFLKGERTTKENVFNMCKNIMGYEITEEEFNKNFRPATEEETTRKTLVEVYQASVDSATKEPEQPKDELTEFEKKVRDVITSELCNNFGDVSFGISISDNEARLIAKKLLPVARKQIASELESMVDTMVSQNGGMCVHYREGIEDAINKIKGESV